MDDLAPFLQQILEERSECTKSSTSKKFTEFKKPTSTHEFSLNDFEPDDEIIKGSGGPVILGKSKSTGKGYALKVYQLEKAKTTAKSREVNVITSYHAREVELLYAVQHDHVVGLEYAFFRENMLCLLMERYPHDLESCLEGKKFESADMMKRWMYQLLNALEYLHERKISHRDIKPANILVDEIGNIKLADFEVSRFIYSDSNLTPAVTTLQYSAPELLLKCDSYSPAIDLWSAGCVFAEIAESKNLFKEVNGPKPMLEQMFRKLGVPTEAEWPGVTSYPLFPNDISACPPQRDTIAPHLDEIGLDLLLRLLTYNPASRISASDALKHPYFGN